MATDEISARTAADFSVRLMNKEKIGMPKIRDMERNMYWIGLTFQPMQTLMWKMCLKMCVLSITHFMIGIGMSFIF